MTLGTISKSLAIASLLSVTAACSQHVAPNSQKIQTKTAHLRDALANRPTRNAENRELSCDAIWTAFVATNPLGYSKAYQSTTLTEYAGGEGLPVPDTVVEISKDTVTASSDASVTITYDYTSPDGEAPPSTETQTVSKVDFLAQCQAPAAEPTPSSQPEPTLEITEQGSEKVTVQAGEFDTDFVIGTVTQTGDNAYTAIAHEWYVKGTDFLVKSTFESTAVFDSISVKTTQTIELISLVNAPAFAVVQ